MSKGPPRMVVIAQAIAATADANGDITPEAVWRAAKADPDNPLHREFEWDESKAARERWEARAAELIRQCKSIMFHLERKVLYPTFVSSVDSVCSAYVNTRSIPAGSDQSKVALLREILQIRGDISRLLALAIVWEVNVHLEDILALLARTEYDLMKPNDEEGGAGDGNGDDPGLSPLLQ